jgi:hypothetical protein
VKKNITLRYLLGVALMLLGFEVAQAVPATTYTVTSANDDSGRVAPCMGTAPTFSCATLRDAITQANRDTTSPTINFSSSIAGSTIVLASTLPTIAPSSPLTIDGTGASITISGAGLYEVMFINGGAVTINALTIANGLCNSDSCPGNAQGGGVYAFCSECDPSVTISNSTFSGNSAGQGGAIYSYEPLMIINSTFYNNSATAGGGGAVVIDGSSGNGNLAVTNSTFSSNTSVVYNGDEGRNVAVAGSAIYAPAYATATLTNNILAAEVFSPQSTNPGNCLSAPGQGFTDGGGNLSDDTSTDANPDPCGFGDTSQYNVPDTGSGEIQGLNLGPLASNGGPTQTIALLSNSVAISYGTNCPATDQRGVARPAMCSSGAYQYAPVQNGTGTAAGCTFPSTCNITGGETQQIAAGTTDAGMALGNLMGNAAVITENICTVNMDQRKICGGTDPSSPYYKSQTLPLAAMCPTLPPPGAGTSVLPDYLCGAYGPSGAGSGTGFAVIQGIADGVNGIPGLLIMNDANPDAFFPPGGNSASECTPAGAYIDNISDGWGPWSFSLVEGSIPEGNRIVDLTDGCGGGKQTSGGMSLMVNGVALTLANATDELGFLPKTLVNFAEYKYGNLFAELVEDPIDTPNKVRLLEIVAQSAVFLAARKDGCAEDTLYEADLYVINNASHFHGVPALDPNSYGRTRSRILNLFFTIFTRKDGGTNPITNNGAYINFPLLAPSLAPPMTNPPISPPGYPPASCSVPYLGKDGY